jgi:Amt family ammonium transporter
MRQLARIPWAAMIGLTLIVALALLPGVALAQDVAPAAVEPAAAEPAAPTEPTVEQRLANLEAYVTNGAPDPAGGALGATAGAAHNGWMMTCAALVLFMTLPGLALFYGGLVRRKNALSVLALCFGCAGVVTLLWWAVGYSLVFDSGNAIIGGFSFAFFDGVTAGDCRPGDG